MKVVEIMTVDPTPPPGRHLESAAVAAYLDAALPPSDRARVEAHAAECAECRHELIEVARVLHGRNRRPRWSLAISLAGAAAALLLFFVWPRPGERPTGAPGYREPAVTTTVSPAVIAPRGVIPAATTLTWTSVPGVDRYRVMLFDETGRVVWETQRGDTSALLPDSVHLQRGRRYLWKVEAQTSWDRWVGSEFVEFSIGPPQP
jgi:putative zinc finger protein